MKESRTAETGMKIAVPLITGIQPAENEPLDGMKIPVPLIPDIQPAENEPLDGMKIAVPLITDIQPVENEPEDLREYFGVDLPEAQASADDEPDMSVRVPVPLISDIQPAENETLAGMTIPVPLIPDIQPVENEPGKTLAHLFAEGSWMPSADPLVIGEANFSAMQNLRFAERCLEGVPGYSKINATTALSTYPKIRSGIQLRTPFTTKSRVLVQAYNAALTASQILQNKTAIPNQGDFEADALNTDAAGAGLGRFAKWPGNQIAYCNGVESKIYGGDEIPCAAFLNIDDANTFFYDFTEMVRNSDIGEIATFAADSGGGGAGADVALLLHLDNNVTDSGPTGHTVTNTAVTFTTSSKFGTHAAVFNGTTAKLTVPDHADFDFSDGTWTIDFWATLGTFWDGTLYYQETPVTKIIFSSGSHEVAVNDTVTQTASGATGTVLSVSVTSGTWAGGDAAGTIWLGSVTGVWTNGNTMIETTDQLAGAGDFTGGTDGWTLAAGWAYGTDNVLKNGDGVGTLSKDTLAAVVGQVYNVTYTISGLTVGDVTASFGGASGTARSANGTYTETLTAVSTAGLAFTPSNTARFTIDSVTVKIVPLSCGTCTTDINYFLIFGSSIGETTNGLGINIRAYGATTNVFFKNAFSVPSGLNHFEFSENGNTWYFFLNGTLLFSTTNAVRAANYLSTVFIGYDNSSIYYAGTIDEFRVSKTCRHTVNFSVPVAAYEVVGGSGDIGNILIGALRPLQGIKFYIQTANNSTANATLYYWSGSAWSAVSALNDATAAGGKTMNVTGGASITFTSTVGSAKPKYIRGYFLYFYRLSLSGIDPATSIYQITLDAPFQSVVDLWDGTPILLSSCLRYVAATSSYKDFTLEVAENSQAAFAEFDALATTEYILFGSPIPLAGFKIQLSTDTAKVNANNADLTVKYCNGSAIANWPSVTGLTDDTTADLKSFKQSGAVSFSPIAPGGEFKISINGGDPQYYYKLSFNAALSAAVEVYYITGIAAPLKIKPYKFPFSFLNRAMLCGYLAGNEGNRVDYAMNAAADVWNGPDSSGGVASLPLYFGGGEDLTAACEVYNRLGSSIYSFAIFTKEYETYILNGYDALTFRIYPISSVYGCAAPLTMDTYQVGISKDAQSVRSIAMWLSHSGPIMFDSGGLVPVPGLECYFDRRDSRCINSSAIKNSRGWFDPDSGDYNLQIPSGAGQTTNNVWVALSVKHQKWYPVVPSVAVNPYLGAAFRVADADGRQYVYGARDNGYMMRVHDPAVATWDGTASVQSVTLGDLLCSGNMWDRIRLLMLKLFGISTTEDIAAAVTHYADGATAGTSLTAVALNATPRYFKNTQPLNVVAWSHQIKISVTVSTETRGMRLLGWGLKYIVEREDT